MTDFLSIQPAAAQSHVKDGTGSSYTIAKYDGATIDVEDYAGDIAIIQAAAAQYQEAVNKMEVAGGAYQVAADKMAKACERAFHE